MIVGSSLYRTPVYALTRFASVSCVAKKSEIEVSSVKKSA
jgi:hypothetical protein